MVFFTFVLGLAIGSFLNVLIDRLPRGQDVIRGRSHCDHCKKKLRWFELIPVFSYLIQGGRCLRCHRKLSFQYPLIELITAFGTVMMVSTFSSIGMLIGSLLLFYCGLVLLVADLKYYMLPDSMIVGCAIGSLFILFASPISAQQLMIRAAAGLAAGFLFWIIWRVTKGRGMGFGDVKLAGVIGWLFGYPGTILALYLAFLTGATVGVILMVAGKKTLKSRIPFGPFLILASFVTYVWHNALLTMVSRFLSF